MLLGVALGIVAGLCLFSRYPLIMSASAILWALIIADALRIAPWG